MPATPLPLPRQGSYAHIPSPRRAVRPVDVVVVGPHGWARGGPAGGRRWTHRHRAGGRRPDRRADGRAPAGRFPAGPRGAPAHHRVPGAGAGARPAGSGPAAAGARRVGAPSGPPLPGRRRLGPGQAGGGAVQAGRDVHRAADGAPERTAAQALAERGLLGLPLAGLTLDGFLRPLLVALLGDPGLGTSSRVADLALRGYARGRLCLPAAGVSAMPLRLAEALPPGSVRLGVRVTAVSAGRGRERTARARRLPGGGDRHRCPRGRRRSAGAAPTDPPPGHHLLPRRRRVALSRAAAAASNT